MSVYEIPGKLKVTWNDEAKAIIDTWTSYSVTLDEFKEAVLVQGVNHGKSHGVKAWIVDSSQAKGSFKQEIQDFIGSDVFPTFAKIGVKYFITIASQESAITRMSIKHYQAKTGPNGLELVELPSAADAIEWLKLHSKMAS